MFCATPGFCKIHCRISSCVLVRPRPSVSFSGTMMAMKNMIGTPKSWNGKRPRKGPSVVGWHSPWLPHGLAGATFSPTKGSTRPRVQDGQYDRPWMWSCAIHKLLVMRHGPLDELPRKRKTPGWSIYNKDFDYFLMAPSKCAETSHKFIDYMTLYDYIIKNIIHHLFTKFT